MPEQISKELSNGYIILREHSAFPSYDGLLAVSGKLIPDPGISIYESDDSLEAKYLAAIDVFEFKYIIPLDFEKKSLLRIPDVILPVDFANIEKCTIFPFDYSMMLPICLRELMLQESSITGVLTRRNRRNY